MGARPSKAAGGPSKAAVPQAMPVAGPEGTPFGTFDMEHAEDIVDGRCGGLSEAYFIRRLPGMVGEGASALY